MAERTVVIGVGPAGDLAASLPPDVDLVVGGPRHLATFAPAGVATVAIGGDLTEVTAAVARTPGTVVVLASGDPGWFGIVRRLRADLGPDHPSEVHPAASSVAGAFAAIGRSWEDAAVVSAHGRALHAAIATALAHPKVAVLTAPDTPPSALGRALLAAGCGERRAVVVVRLGHADATVHEVDLRGLAALTAADPNVLLLLDEPRLDRRAATTVAHAPPARAWARATDAFVHRDGQVSKPEVRALALARLAAGPGRLLWDVGCGAGSVAVEAAGLGAGVIAIDRDPDQLDRARRNAADHRVGIGLVHGGAPGALDGLPDPDAVFVGGGGDALPAIVDVVLDRCRDRVVVALATVERAGPLLDQVRAAGWEARAELVQVSDLVPIGAAGHRLRPRNPVLLVTGDRP